MKPYFAYIRVSTVRQGEHGSSLQEQRDAISSFASRNDLSISSWFEDRETAAKSGRREFSRMLAALNRGAASGVIIHKIDRSARNLRDWASIQDLAEAGLDVRFTQESVNLHSNEGRLTGDFLAVIAAHYIRNLRDEVKKGLRGRLKQGIYPFAAPIGYLDQGGGKPKTVDPVKAPLIIRCFERYATGTVSLRLLERELFDAGLRSKTGKMVRINRLADILRNPFYTGIIRIKRSGEVFDGAHEPLIQQSLFDRVQSVFGRKTAAKTIVHDFLFRRMISCAFCGHSLIGELQKGTIYYRCHNPVDATSVRHDVVEREVWSHLYPLCLDEKEIIQIELRVQQMDASLKDIRVKQLRGIALALQNIKHRLSKLTDAYLEGDVERSLYDEKKLNLLQERQLLEQQQTGVNDGRPTARVILDEYLELLKTLSLSYKSAKARERREMIISITSNLKASGKNVVVELRSPFKEIENAARVLHGGPSRYNPRTNLPRRQDFIPKVFKLLQKHAAAANDPTLLENRTSARAA
jgi:DNA invertase Pin-like site-specific DNA recombinase